MFLVGVAGGSGSGKTTFAKKIISQLPVKLSQEVLLVHQDSYYLPKLQKALPTDLPSTKEAKINFDHPSAFDWKLLRSHLKDLRSGLQVQAPVYDFRSQQRLVETVPLGPGRAILLEGIYVFLDPEIRALLDLKIYLDVPADVRFIRRFYRDRYERARDLDSIVEQYYAHVRPMHYEFLKPTQLFADLLVGEQTDLAAQVVGAHLKERISQLESN